MKDFSFTVDYKVLVWKRDRAFIEAESLEKAIELAKNFEYDCTSTEYLGDTEVCLDPEDNYPSIEISMGDKVLWSN